MNRVLLAALLSALGCRSEAREGVVERKCAEPGRPFTLGVVADSKEPLPATLDNVKRFAGVFAREKVAAVLALGGLGTTEDEIARVLAALKEARAPVLALPGDREPEAAFHAAVERARKAGLDVVDLAQNRAVDGGGFALVSLPGYPWPHYLGAGALGCRYGEKDVQGLRALFDSIPGERPRILASHTPPRGDGPDAVDWRWAAPTWAIRPPDARAAGVGRAAGGVRPRGRSGRTRARHRRRGRRWRAGPAGGECLGRAGVVERGRGRSVPHLMDAGASSRGQAALVEFSDGKLRFKVIR